MALHQLVQLQAHQAGNGGCGGGDGRDDPPCDAFALWSKQRHKHQVGVRSPTAGGQEQRGDSLQKGILRLFQPTCVAFSALTKLSVSFS